MLLLMWFVYKRLSFFNRILLPCFDIGKSDRWVYLDWDDS